MENRDFLFLQKSLVVSTSALQNVLSLLDEGMTVPFISRYRKEMTGSLDEVKVEEIREAYESLKELNERKATVLKTIDEQGKLTEELKEKIQATYEKSELEDLYLPYKPKRRTKATIAKEKGLEPLALLILDPREEEEAEAMALPFVDTAKGVSSLQEALEGAGHIVAELYNEDSSLRALLRKLISTGGSLAVSALPEWKEQRSKFEQYYDFQEPLRTIPSHRILATERGEREGVLRIKIDVDREELIGKAAAAVIPDPHPRRELLCRFLEDSYVRLLFPSLELEIRGEMKEKADEEAIRVFASNLENLLLASPAGSIPLLAVDPGFRTGCKVVALGETGSLLENTTIFPTPPQERVEEAEVTVKGLMAKHRLKAVVIGNGTASRESHLFFKRMLKEPTILTVVNEAGASVYSASKIGREEFPDHDLTVRGAVSIGRRFQDPLAELVKIEPKAIGVGQYQHYVGQTQLKKKHDATVVSVVNRVGVDVNTASRHLLRYVSGIGESLAQNIVQHREEKGPFKRREELLNVRLFGPKAFQQSVGFLRIRGGQNPLDNTGIHPESYKVVERMAQEHSVPVDSLPEHKELLSKIQAERFVNDEFGLPTIKDILKELESPGRDPRKDFELFRFTEGVETIEDLNEGMDLDGVVTNVTNFGAFVDIGVHQDGLVHVSEISHRYITTPEEVLQVGQKVKVRVLKVDKELKRIQLSIKALLPSPERRGKGRKGEETKAPKRQEPVKKIDPVELLKQKWKAK